MPFTRPTFPMQPLSFTIPAAATTLEHGVSVTCDQMQGVAGSGRGCHISEMLCGDGNVMVEGVLSQTTPVHVCMLVASNKIKIDSVYLNRMQTGSMHKPKIRIHRYE